MIHFQYIFQSFNIYIYIHVKFKFFQPKNVKYIHVHTIRVNILLICQINRKKLNKIRSIISSKTFSPITNRQRWSPLSRSIENKCLQYIYIFMMQQWQSSNRGFWGKVKGRAGEGEDQGISLESESLVFTFHIHTRAFPQNFVCRLSLFYLVKDLVGPSLPPTIRYF